MFPADDRLSVMRNLVAVMRNLVAVMRNLVAVTRNLVAVLTAAALLGGCTVLDILI